MFLARHNALEFTVAGGRPVVRRYVVHACVIEGGRVVRAELADAPDETLRLPLTRDEALRFVHRHFEDLDGAAARELIRRLAKPTGPVLVRSTDRLI